VDLYFIACLTKLSCGTDHQMYVLKYMPLKELKKFSVQRILTVSVVHATFFLSSSRFFSLSLSVGVVEGSETSSASTTTVVDPVDGVGSAQADD